MATAFRLKSRSEVTLGLLVSSRENTVEAPEEGTGVFVLAHGSGAPIRISWLGRIMRAAVMENIVLTNPMPHEKTFDPAKLEVMGNV